MTALEVELRNAFAARRLVTVIGLTLAWCALWGSFSVANVLSGVIVSVGGLAFGVTGRGRGGIRIVPLMQLAGLVAADMVRSTVAVIREVLTPTDYTAEGIIEVEVPIEVRAHLVLVYVAITVTPGTAVVAAEEDGSVLYLHVLHSEESDAVRAHTVQLAELANRALPTPPDELPVMGDRAPEARAEVTTEATEESAGESGDDPHGGTST